MSKRSTDSLHHSMSELIYVLLTVAILALLVFLSTLKAKTKELNSSNDELLKAQQQLAINIEELRLTRDDLTVAQQQLATKTKELNLLQKKLTKIQQQLATKTDELNQVNDHLVKAQQQLTAKIEQLKLANEELDRTQQQLAVQTEGLRFANDQLSNTRDKLNEIWNLTKSIKSQVQLVKVMIVTKKREVKTEDNNKQPETTAIELRSLEENLKSVYEQMKEILTVTEETEAELTKNLIAQACYQNDKLSIPTYLATITIVEPNTFELEIGGQLLQDNIDGIKNRFRKEGEIARLNNCFLIIRVKSGTNDYNKYNEGFKLLAKLFFIVKVD